MPFTQGRWTSNIPAADGQLYIAANEWIDTSANSTLASAGPGLLSANIAASKACTFFTSLRTMLRATAIAYAAAGPDQRQFGTALGVPGPSAVANTSGPLAIPAGYPGYTNPYTPPTVAGAMTGPAPKGIQINWVDVLYGAFTVNLSAATIGITNTVYANGAAPTVTNLLALGNNNLPLTFQAQPRRYRITPTTIAMLTADGSGPIINLNLTTPAGGTAIFYGVIVGISHNLQ